MTPKEKANQLIDRYLDIENYNNFNLDLFCDECGMSLQAAKYCALIAVDEIYNSGLLIMVEDEQYWYDVKQEIELL